MRRTVLMLVATVVIVAMAVSSAFSQQAACSGLNTAGGQLKENPTEDLPFEVVQHQRVEHGCEILT